MFKKLLSHFFIILATYSVTFVCIFSFPTIVSKNHKTNHKTSGLENIQYLEDNQYDDEEYYDEEYDDEEYNERKRKSDKPRKKITDELIPLLDIYLYIGGGFGQVTSQKNVRPFPSNNFIPGSRYRPEEIFNIERGLPLTGEFTTNAMIAVALFGFKIDYSRFFYRPSSPSQQRLSYTNSNSGVVLNNLNVNRGAFDSFRATLGLNVGRKRKKASYHYIYFGYDYLHNSYSGTYLLDVADSPVNPIGYSATNSGHGFIGGYEMLEDISFTGFLGFLISFGLYAGYLPVTNTRFRSNNIDVRNTLARTADIPSRAANFTVGTKLGLGLKIYGIQLLLEYRFRYQAAISAPQDDPESSLLLFQSGQVNNVVILLGYKF